MHTHTRTHTHTHTRTHTRARAHASPMADPDSVMERCLEREGASVRMQRHIETLTAELEAHMAEMDRRIVERLEALMNEPFAFLRSGSVGMGKSMRTRRLSTLFASSAADGLDDLRHCGRMVHCDEIQPDHPDEGAHIEYLKSLVQDETPPEPPRRCPLPKRLERKGREAERRAQKVRSRRQQPARVPKR
jgi:hypothetical protein